MSTPPPPAEAGAWTRDAGGWFVKLGIEQWETGRRFDPAGTRVDYLAPAGPFVTGGDFRSQALRVYVEHGVTDEWTLTGATAFERLRARGHGQFLQHEGLSDLTLQVKRRLLAAPILVSALGEVKLPTGYDVTRTPALGSGQVDAGGRLAAGASHGALYVSGEAGYRARGGRADEIPFLLEAGLTVPGNILLRGELGGATTLRAPSAAGPFDPATAESRHLSGGLALVLRGRPLDLVFALDHVLGGRNTLAGTRYSFSVWHVR